ncbi:hypothetical protein PV646_28860 [Streptomyces sp. ID05-26A]|nr:hypothetical protein [Streptomyces sp. ID05-26A]
MPRPLQALLLWFISAAWVANLVISYFKPALGQPAVNAAFMVVAAILYRQLRREKKNADTDDEGSVADMLNEARQTVAELTDPDKRDKRGDAS